MLFTIATYPTGHPSGPKSNEFLPFLFSFSLFTTYFFPPPSTMQLPTRNFISALSSPTPLFLFSWRHQTSSYPCLHHPIPQYKSSSHLQMISPPIPRFELHHPKPSSSILPSTTTMWFSCPCSKFSLAQWMSISKWPFFKTK